MHTHLCCDVCSPVMLAGQRGMKGRKRGQLGSEEVENGPLFPRAVRVDRGGELLHASPEAAHPHACDRHAHGRGAVPRRVVTLDEYMSEHKRIAFEARSKFAEACVAAEPSAELSLSAGDARTRAVWASIAATKVA